MNYDQLTAGFPGRRLTKIVNTTRLCPLRHAEIATYSCLVNRATHAKGARQNQISRATGLHESTAVPKALSSLQRHGLVEKRGEYWWALEPSAATLPWFKYRRDTVGERWCRRFSYWWAGIRKRKSSLTAKQASLYFKLLNLQESGRPITVRGLARLLGVDVKTVSQGLKKLKGFGLVTGLEPNPPTPAQVKWFQLGREKQPFSVTAHFGCFDDEDQDGAILSKRFVDKCGNLLLTAGFSERQAINYVRMVLKTAKRWSIVSSFFVKFEAFFRDIEKQHQANVAQGKYTKAKNCRGLLEIETQKKITALRR